MIFKKKEANKFAVQLFILFTALALFIGLFSLYNKSSYVKGEYDRICPQNYGDKLSLDRCYLAYKFEGESLSSFLKISILLSILSPLTVLAIALIKPSD